MNDMVDLLSLSGDKLMPEIHLKQPGFTYCACGSFTKSKERIQNFKETWDSRYIYQNELDKACFQHNMSYRNFKDLIRRIASDKMLRYKAFNIAINRKYDLYRGGLASKVYKYKNKRAFFLLKTIK